MTTAPEDQSEREALRELVALEDLKERAKALPGEPDGFGMKDVPGPTARAMMAEYESRLPAAWQAARAALRAPKVEAPSLADFDAAVAAELSKMSTVPYNSHAICKLFAENVRAALSHPLPALAPLQVDNKPHQPKEQR
jgi:hypothetical protein